MGGDEKVLGHGSDIRVDRRPDGVVVFGDEIFGFDGFFLFAGLIGGEVSSDFEIRFGDVERHFARLNGVKGGDLRFTHQKKQCHGQYDDQYQLERVHVVLCF